MSTFQKSGENKASEDTQLCLWSNERSENDGNAIYDNTYGDLAGLDEKLMH